MPFFSRTIRLPLIYGNAKAPLIQFVIVRFERSLVLDLRRTRMLFKHNFILKFTEDAKRVLVIRDAQLMCYCPKIIVLIQNLGNHFETVKMSLLFNFKNSDSLNFGAIISAIRQ